MAPMPAGKLTAICPETCPNMRIAMLSMSLPLCWQMAAGSRSRTTGTAMTGRGVSFRRSEEHTSELQSLMRTSYAVLCLKNKTIRLSVRTEEKTYEVHKQMRKTKAGLSLQQKTIIKDNKKN